VPILNTKKRVSANLIAQEALYTALTTSNTNLTIIRSKYKSATKQLLAALCYCNLVQSSSSLNLSNSNLILDLLLPNLFYCKLAAS
jgi:hypothetical protein